MVGMTCAMVFVALPTRAEALRCKVVARIRLAPVDPAAVPRMRGTAKVVACSDGSSLLQVQVRAKGLEGLPFVATLPSLQPVIGDWFYISKNKGEGFIQNIYKDQLHGRAVAVADGNFNEVLTAVFP